jgi:hypothetical protein
MCKLDFQGLLPSYVEADPKILLHVQTECEAGGGNWPRRWQFQCTPKLRSHMWLNPEIPSYVTAVMLQFDAFITIIIDEYAK